MNGAVEPAVVLDTDVLSFIFHDDPVRVPRYRPHYDGRLTGVAFVSIAEMRFGAKRRGWGRRRRDELERFIAKHLVLESTPEIGILWAQIRCDALRIGRTIEKQDAWIAAVALHLDVPLVTHNGSDYRHIPGLRVITEPDG